MLVDFHSMLPTQALALSANLFVHKKNSLIDEFLRVCTREDLN